MLKYFYYNYFGINIKVKFSHFVFEKFFRLNFFWGIWGPGLHLNSILLNRINYTIILKIEKKTNKIRHPNLEKALNVPEYIEIASWDIALIQTKIKKIKIKVLCRFFSIVSFVSVLYQYTQFSCRLGLSISFTNLGNGSCSIFFTIFSMVNLNQMQ